MSLPNKAESFGKVLTLGEGERKKWGLLGCRFHSQLYETCSSLHKSPWRSFHMYFHVYPEDRNSLKNILCTWKTLEVILLSQPWFSYIAWILLAKYNITHKIHLKSTQPDLQTATTQQHFDYFESPGPFVELYRVKNTLFFATSKGDSLHQVFHPAFDVADNNKLPEKLTLAHWWSLWLEKINFPSEKTSLLWIWKTKGRV